MLLGSPFAGAGQARRKGVGQRSNPAGVRAGAQPRPWPLTVQPRGPPGSLFRLGDSPQPLRAAGCDAGGGRQPESVWPQGEGILGPRGQDSQEGKRAWAPQTPRASAPQTCAERSPRPAFCREAGPLPPPPQPQRAQARAVPGLRPWLRAGRPQAALAGRESAGDGVGPGSVRLLRPPSPHGEGSGLRPGVEAPSERLRRGARAGVEVRESGSGRGSGRRAGWARGSRAGRARLQCCCGPRFGGREGGGFVFRECHQLKSFSLMEGRV